MIAAVAGGQFDVGMDGITITEERAEQVDFSNPYLRSQQFMLVRADEERFSTPADFAADEEMLIGSQPGRPAFTLRSTRCWMAMNPIRASSSSTTSAHRCRR
ncbi:MAG: transporter substrate-binding domain-containing protein [Caldilineaceae bacterium]|nr:transporter substrate-binding domain-containing protein [Caldilineaceae bacterium]